MKLHTHEELKEGIVHAYTHQNRIAAVVEMRCKTDFAARTDEFKTLAHELTLQIASMNPCCVTALLDQDWVKDPGVKISDLIHAAEEEIQEPIVVTNILRLELGA